MSFLPRFRLRDTDREAPTGHVHAKVLQRTALGRSGSRPRSSRERSANATQGLLTVSCMCKNIKKKKETRPGLI